MIFYKNDSIGSSQDAMHSKNQLMGIVMTSHDRSESIAKAVGNLCVYFLGRIWYAMTIQFAVDSELSITWE